MQRGFAKLSRKQKLLPFSGRKGPDSQKLARKWKLTAFSSKGADSQNWRKIENYRFLVDSREIDAARIRRNWPFSARKWFSGHRAGEIKESRRSHIIGAHCRVLATSRAVGLAQRSLIIINWWENRVKGNELSPAVETMELRRNRPLSALKNRENENWFLSGANLHLL